MALTPARAETFGATPNIKSMTAAPWENPPRTSLVFGQVFAMNWA